MNGRLTEFKPCENYPTSSQIIEEHVTYVQGHKVKYSNRNNSAVDCSISLKFGTDYHHVIGNALEIFKVKAQGHSVV